VDIFHFKPICDTLSYLRLVWIFSIQGFFALVAMVTFFYSLYPFFKVILYSYLILKKMNERITDS